MAKKDKKKKDGKKGIDDAIDRMRKAGEDLRKEVTDENGVVLKSIAAGMSPLPKEARKSLIEAHKKTVEAGRVMSDHYLDMVEKLLKKVS